MGLRSNPTLPVSTNRPAQPAVSAAAPVTDLSAAIKQLNVDPAAAKQVQDQYLSSSDAATRAKYNELLSGLQSGQISADGLRAQAQSAVDQLKSYKKELGPEAGDALNSYLAGSKAFCMKAAGPALPTQPLPNPENKKER